MKILMVLKAIPIILVVILISATGSQAKMINWTITEFDASSGALTLTIDDESEYTLNANNFYLHEDQISINPGTLVGTLYKFVIPNFYDPLPEKTIEITITGSNNSTSGLDLARVLDVSGADSQFNVTSPALYAQGHFVSGTTSPTTVSELWEIFPNPDFETVTIWVPDLFGLVSVKIVTQSIGLQPNLPPDAICQDVNISTKPGLCIGDASVDGGSYDPDDDPITLYQAPPGPYDLGTTEVTLTVKDDKDASDECSANVTIIDQELPTINNLSATPNRLWPPNHEMVQVNVTVDASDNCDDSPSCQIFSVISNEPENGSDDGNTTPDWEITGDLTVKLRSERSGTGVGRDYTISVQCIDESGNSSTANTNVSVPLSK